MGGRDLRAARMAGVLEASGGSGGGAGASAPAPSSSSAALGSLGSFSSHAIPGGSRLLAASVREEGARTTWLLSPPPTLRVEATPEHPSWHFASSARLAQTGTVVPEQAFARIARLEKHAGQRATGLAVEANRTATHAADFAFARADVASRVARKREERAGYRDAVMARKMGQEQMLCAPHAVGEVQM